MLCSIIINVDDFLSSDIMSTTSADTEFQTKADILDVAFVVNIKKNSKICCPSSNTP